MNSFELLVKTLTPVALRSREDAEDVYRALCNVGWANKDCTATNYEGFDFNDGSVVAVSWRSAGGIVADMVGDDEDYLSYYCSGGEGNITHEIEQLLEEQGFRPLV